MTATAESTDLAARIAEEAAALPAEKLRSVLDYVLFIKERAGAADGSGDAAWERIIADPRPRPKLEAFVKSMEHEDAELLDISRMR